MKKNQTFIDSTLDLQSVLDALSAHVAILDENGVIIVVNQNWRKFATENGLKLKEFGIGANYLEICDAATGEGSEIAALVASTIRKVQQGQPFEEAIEYSCDSPKERRWFQTRISKFMQGRGYVIVIHQNITAKKIAEEKNT